MIRLQIQLGGVREDIERALPVLVEKMTGHQPDRKDTATLAYTILVGILAKIKKGEFTPLYTMEYQISNDAASALQNQLSAIGVMRATLDQIDAHLETVSKENERRRRELLRRNSVPVRQSYRVRRGT